MLKASALLPGHTFRHTGTTYVVLGVTLDPIAGRAVVDTDKGILRIPFNVSLRIA